MAGAKLALRDRGGRIGRFTIRFGSVAQGATAGRAAEAARAVIDDRRAVAVIGGRRTATAPLFNAAGLLQVAVGSRDGGASPDEPPSGAAVPGDAPGGTAAGRLEPSGRTTLARLEAAAPPPGFARRFAAASGRPPGPRAALGHAAMTQVLDAIAAAGARARVRQAVVDAFLRRR